MSTSIPSDLTNAIKDNKLILFIGAGLSQKLGLPNWKDLTINIIKELQLDYQGLESFILPLTQGWMQPIEVLTKIGEITKDKGKILQSIEKQLKITDNCDLSLHKKLFTLSGKTITTNYDKAFEKANSNARIIHKESDFSLANLTHYPEYILKIHGCIESPDNCILFHEDYTKFYNKENASLFELKTSISKDTILFIGFGMSDPYIKELFSFIKDLYNGYSPKHYLITTDINSDFEKDYNIKSILLNSYNQLDGYIDKLIQSKPPINTLPSTETINIIRMPQPSELIIQPHKITILRPDPIDIEFDFKDPIYRLEKFFKEYNTLIDLYFLSRDNIRNLEECDYIVIFTHTYKNKIYIENGDIESELITVQELLENLPNNNFKALILFSDNKIGLEDISIPVIHIPNYKNDAINTLLFQLVKKKKIQNLSDFHIYNITEANFVQFGNGISQINKNETKLSDVSTHSADKFIGRRNDLLNLTRKIAKLGSTNKALTIKGAGGIGKTTLVLKLALLFSKRNYFKDGIHFISCEQITNVKSLENRIAQAFDLDHIINLKEYLEANYNKQDKLIIFDNFETLTTLEHHNDIEEIKKLIEFITDYASIIITSREVIGYDYEDVYPLSNLSTDDALELFQLYYKVQLDREDEKILRHDILENLLNNNTLAIKIITKNLVRNKSISELKMELEEQFFRTTSIDYDSIFDDAVDINIEKRKSLYHSINFSYQKLNKKEQLVFELLHLFPDGISLQNLKLCFQKKNTKPGVTISDKEIRSLEDKSLIEILDDLVKLQPIVRKFAQFRFEKRSDIEKSSYYLEAYFYNEFVLQLIANLPTHIRVKRSSLFDKYANNFLFSITYSDKINDNKEKIMIYIAELSNYLLDEDSINTYIKNTNQKRDYFSDYKNSNLFFEINQLSMIFHHRNFDFPFKKLTQMLPFDKITQYKPNLKLDRNIIFDALHLYSYEGYTIDAIRLLDKFNIYNYGIDNDLFYIGYYYKNIFDSSAKDFFYYEYLLNTNQLLTQDITDYIVSIYKKDHLEKMQCMYNLAKVEKVNKKDINKLVVTNPYTKGLKNLMLAFIEEDQKKKRKLFEEGIINLEHIKYYYIEGIYFYAKYLKEIHDTNYEMWYEKGYGLADKYYYRFLKHKFICLKKGIEIPYDEKDYPLPDDLEIGIYIEKLNKYKRNNN